MIFFDLAQIWLPGEEAWLVPDSPHDQPADDTSGTPTPAAEADRDR